MARLTATREHRRCGIFVARAGGFFQSSVRSGISDDVAPSELGNVCERMFYKDAAPLALSHGLTVDPPAAVS